MKRLTILLTAAAALFYLSALPLFAQHGPGGGHGAGSGLGAGHGAAGVRGDADTSGGGKSTHAESKERLTSFFADKDSKLYQRISTLAAADGTTIAALQGMNFKNLGQLIATVHVYHNLGIDPSKTPFSEFAAAVTAKGGSLGKAIKQFNPSADAPAELKKGKQQANNDLSENS